MDFFKKIFSTKNKKLEQSEKIQEKEPKDKMSIDEHFVYHFVKKGGYFFYPNDMDDFKSELLKILQLTQQEYFSVIERAYYHLLKKMKIPVRFDNFSSDDILLGGCELLISNESAIMTTSRQTGEYRNTQLPQKRLIVSMSNQIVADKTEAMTFINKKYETPPSNIQTMSIFAPTENSIVQGQWYEVYLFLIEN